MSRKQFFQGAKRPSQTLPEDSVKNPRNTPSMHFKNSRPSPVQTTSSKTAGVPKLSRPRGDINKVSQSANASKLGGLASGMRMRSSSMSPPTMRKSKKMG